MNLYMSHYSHKSILDAKFKADISSSFRDMTSLREQVIKFGYLPTENGFIFKKMSFLSRIVLLDPKLTPMSISAIFKQKKLFHFSFLGCLDEKRAEVTPLIDQFLIKFGQN